MSVFSSVDEASDPSRIVAYLDHTAHAASSMKHYAMAAHALQNPDGLVLDVGCGAGHDLALLGQAGIRAVGVDPSSTLLSAAQCRATEMACLVRATGEALPFGDRSVAGCRMERVLMHVVNPSVVLAEIARCLREGALLTVFRGERGDEPTPWIATARHPDVGGRLWDLVEAAGFDVLDRVEEMSVWRSLDMLDGVVGVESSVDGAIVCEVVPR